MVRKTLEEICADRGADGGNLRKKIEALGTTVVLPQTLLTGLDDLRLSGTTPHTLSPASTSRSGRRNSRLRSTSPKRSSKPRTSTRVRWAGSASLKKDRQAQQ